MKPLALNKTAAHSYQILETFEAGMVLLGHEVKSIRMGRLGLKGSYVVLREEEAFLVGASIPAYQPKNTPEGYSPDHARKLLLKKTEIKYLLGKSSQKGLTMVPLKVYSKRGKIKLEFALAKGLREIDKREKIKKREVEREMRRTINEKS